jgi:hypothetical protein
MSDNVFKRDKTETWDGAERVSPPRPTADPGSRLPTAILWHPEIFGRLNQSSVESADYKIHLWKIARTPRMILRQDCVCACAIFPQTVVIGYAWPCMAICPPSARRAEF